MQKRWHGLRLLPLALRERLERSSEKHLDQKQKIEMVKYNYADLFGVGKIVSRFVGHGLLRRAMRIPPRMRDIRENIGLQWKISNMYGDFLPDLKAGVCALQFQATPTIPVRSPGSNRSSKSGVSSCPNVRVVPLTSTFR